MLIVTTIILEKLLHMKLRAPLIIEQGLRRSVYQCKRTLSKIMKWNVSVRLCFKLRVQLKLCRHVYRC